ncbi:Endonuclease-reverse transcriptase [Operophtera brumata]|uniref:Endonuclease-reverse transcriptase n=1 Tax=Operophtera brumata TaxID=104452 RepID=A0A0L7L0M8_OPEBR|nr:Endonuclease-reverse transcriptase [Operophtera brumata]
MFPNVGEAVFASGVANLATRRDHSRLETRRGHDDSSYGGVGFIINKRLTSFNLSVKSISICVCYLTLKLNERYALKIVQVYAPTLDHPNDEKSLFTTRELTLCWTIWSRQPLLKRPVTC